MTVHQTIDEYTFVYNNENNGTKPGIVWEDQSIIDQATNTLFYSFVAFNRYFDFDDYDDPVHIRYDTQTTIGVQGTLQIHSFYVNEHKAELNDDYLSLFSGTKQRKFFSLDSDYDSIIHPSTNEDILFLNLYRSNKKFEYTRTVFTILDLLGSLGGMFEILSIFGGVVVSTLTSKLFNYSILTTLYQVDTSKHKEETLKARINQIAPMPDKRYKKRNEESKYPTPLNGANSYENSSISPRELNFFQNDRSKQNLVSKARGSMKNRRLYSYNTTDLCYNLLWCLKWRYWF